MSMSKTWRGAAAGLFLSVATLGTVAAASPSEAADLRFGVVVRDNHRPPAARFERVPVPPRHYEPADWRPGFWAWRAHRWAWVHGRYERVHERYGYGPDHGRYGRW